jgi:copper(I)-binding protein
VKPFSLLAFTSASALLVSLAACKQSEAPAPAPQESASLDAGPTAKPGISASDGHLILPVVAGRPGAVYFTVRNDGSVPVKLVGVHVGGAGSAQMHKTEGGSMAAVDSLDLAPGAQVDFKQGGMHVMVFDIGETVKASETAELTLTFSDGDKLSMPLRVETMGGDMGGGSDMPGMDH